MMTYKKPITTIDELIGKAEDITRGITVYLPHGWGIHTYLPEVPGKMINRNIPAKSNYFTIRNGTYNSNNGVAVFAVNDKVYITKHVAVVERFFVRDETVFVPLSNGETPAILSYKTVG